MKEIILVILALSNFIVLVSQNTFGDKDLSPSKLLLLKNLGLMKNAWKQMEKVKLNPLIRILLPKEKPIMAVLSLLNFSILIY